MVAGDTDSNPWPWVQFSLPEGPISADLYGPADQDLRSHGVLTVIDQERVSDGITTRRGGAKSSLSGPCYLEGSLGTSIMEGGDNEPS